MNIFSIKLADKSFPLFSPLVFKLQGVSWHRSLFPNGWLAKLHNMTQSVNTSVFKMVKQISGECISTIAPHPWVSSKPNLCTIPNIPCHPCSMVLIEVDVAFQTIEVFFTFFAGRNNHSSIGIGSMYFLFITDVHRFSRVISLHPNFSTRERVKEESSFIPQLPQAFGLATFSHATHGITGSTFEPAHRTCYRVYLFLRVYLSVPKLRKPNTPR